MTKQLRQSTGFARYAALASIVLCAEPAVAATLLGGFGGEAGFGTDSLPLNDDGSSASIDVSAAFPAGLNFYGRSFSAVFVNNNGNITFNAGLSAFTPQAFPVASEPMIAPYWGDVDTRGAGRPAMNGVYWTVLSGQFIATWWNVGYYNSHTDKLNSFQLILTDRSDVGAGAFDVEFRYARCEWTTGDASGGSGGLGGTPAQAGFDAGNLMDYYAIPGSRTANILSVCTSSNVGMPGVWRFPIRPANDTMRVQGDPCMTNMQCANGTCVDGVCCNATCAGQCQSCIVPGFIGQCVPVVGTPVGSRPACGGTPGPCGNVCDGVDTGACMMATASTVCLAGTCSLGVATLPVTCGASLTCVQAMQQACGVYSCGPVGCLTTCTGDLDCAASAVCTAGSCVARGACATGMCGTGEVCAGNQCVVLRPTGATCVSGSDCTSGFCVDGTCSMFGSVSQMSDGGLATDALVVPVDTGPQVYTGDGLVAWSCSARAPGSRRTPELLAVGAAFALMTFWRRRKRLAG